LYSGAGGRVRVPGPPSHHTPSICGEARAGVGFRNTRKVIGTILKGCKYFENDMVRIRETEKS